MSSAMLGLLAETSIHPGAGRSLGVVDLPVARETASGYPVIAGSSLKGALRQAAEQTLGRDSVDVHHVFGRPDQVGGVAVSDARLLLLPVRSLASASCWVTCPQLIERFRRDVTRAGRGVAPPEVHVEKGTALAAAGPHLFLEECSFEVRGEPDVALLDALSPLVRHHDVQARLRERLVVLNDDDFAWFSDFGLPLQARNQLEDDTKQSQNLWYEETLPPDTVMYTLLLSRDNGLLATVRALFDADGYLQAGGNATVGQGWFAVTVLSGGVR